MPTRFIALAIAVAGSAGVCADPLLLDGRQGARPVILLTHDATEPERHAAAELARFLEEALGGRYEVVTFAPNGPPPPSGTVRFLVGPGAARLADPEFSAADLGSEGLVTRSVEGDVILAGGHPRGTLYAVYTFLQDRVGCRWWSSKVSQVPRHLKLDLSNLNVRFLPRLEYRESFWFDAFDGDWAARNRCNGHSERLAARHGGRHVYEGFVHTFYQLIPPDKYFAAHPEWFSEIGGQRRQHGAQLCLSNEEMRAELVRNLRARLKANPAATIASVSQNDCAGACQCARCVAIDAEEGSPAGSLLRLVNAVAAELEPEFPQVAFDTLAYQYTRKPPKLTRPRRNVIVRLCSIECSFAQPLAAERNRAFGDDLRGWSQICDRLYIWDYTTNFAHYILPHPNLRVLGPNIRFFVEHGVKGVFEQGAYQSFGSEMAELRAWVLAQLLWDPARDPQALVDEFLDGYYGPAAAEIRGYLQRTHAAVEASGDPLGCFSGADARFLSFGTLRDGLRHLEAAELAAGGDEGLRHRVRVAQLPVLYAFVVRWEPLRAEARASGAAWPLEDSIREVYGRFLKTAQAEQVTHVSEGRPLGWLAEVVEAAATRPAAP